MSVSPLYANPTAAEETLHIAAFVFSRRVFFSPVLQTGATKYIVVMSPLTPTNIKQALDSPHTLEKRAGFQFFVSCLPPVLQQAVHSAIAVANRTRYRVWLPVSASVTARAADRGEEGIAGGGTSEYLFLCRIRPVGYQTQRWSHRYAQTLPLFSSAGVGARFVVTDRCHGGCMPAAQGWQLVPVPRAPCIHLSSLVWEK